MIAASLAALGCNAIFGIEPGQLAEGGAGGTGAAGASGGAGATPEGGGPSGGGGASCVDNDSQPCFEDDPQKANVGECSPGEQICEGGVFGECVGQVLPTTEDCNDPGDEDCDGNACSDVVWVKQLSADSIFALISDVSADGEILVSGSFRGSLNLGNPPLESATTTGFAAILESDGEVRWAKQMPFDFPLLSFGPSGRVVLSTAVRNPLTLAGTTFTPQGVSDILVALFDSSTGEALSGTLVGGPGEDTGALRVFPSGDFLLFGTTDTGINLGPPIGILAPTVATQGAFIVRLTSDLDPLWGRVIEHDIPSYPFAPNVWVEQHGEKSMVVTNFIERLVEPACPFFGGNQQNVSLSVVDASGTVEWTACTQGNAQFKGVAVSPDGEPTLLLRLDAMTRLQPPLGQTLDVIPNGQADLHIWKVGSSGSTLWSKKFGDQEAQGNEEGFAFGLAYGDDGRLVFASNLQGGIDFGGGITIQSDGDTDAFLSVLLSNGDAAWARAMGGPGPQQSFSTVASVPGTNEIVGAVFSASDIEFGDGTVFTPTSPGGLDSFIVKFQP
jgi:hypothetical protein